MSFDQMTSNLKNGQMTRSFPNTACEILTKDITFRIIIDEIKK